MADDDLPLPEIDEDLAHYRARIHRARVLANEFGRVWGDYLETRPHTFETTVDADGSGRLLLRRLRPMPDELPLILGECLYQLRAALDNALYAAAVLDSGSNPPPGADKLQWPIAATRADFKNQARRLNHLSEHLVLYLGGLQAYRAEQPGWNCLRLLNDMARIDRHRALHVVAMHPTKGRVAYAGDYVSDLAVHPGPLENGDTIATFRYVGDEPLGPQHIDGDWELEIDLADVTFPPGPNGVPGRPYGPLDRRLDTINLHVHMYAESLVSYAQNPPPPEEVAQWRALAASEAQAESRPT